MRAGGTSMNMADSVSRESALPSEDERTWGTIAHLAALAGCILPLGNILGPFLVWRLKKDHLPFVATQAKEALNFNITVSLGAVVCALLVQLSIGVLLAAALAIFWLVMTIVAALKANEGIAYRYPFILRPVK